MSEPRPLGRLENTCYACRYDLRGSNARVCSECGAARAARLDFTTREQYDRARVALRGMVLRARESTGQIVGILAGAGTGGGTLWFDAGRRDEAMEALESGGVHEIGPPVPIVDRSDPVCPACDAALGPADESRCPACGAEFLWVDIEEPFVDTEGMLCATCRYDLSGLEPGAVCPECGKLPPTDLDALVERALGPAEPDPAPEEAVAATRARDHVPGLIGMLSLPIAAFLGWMAFIENDDARIALIVAAVCVALAGSMALWRSVWRSSDAN